MEASSYRPSKDPLTPPGIVHRQDAEQSCRSQSHHANLPGHHKGHHREVSLLGVGEGLSRGQPFCLFTLRAGTGESSQCTILRGLDLPRSLGTSRDDSGPGLRWPGVVRIKWELRSGQLNGEQWALDAWALPFAVAAPSTAVHRGPPAQCLGLDKFPATPLQGLGKRSLLLQPR